MQQQSMYSTCLIIAANASQLATPTSHSTTSRSLTSSPSLPPPPPFYWGDALVIVGSSSSVVYGLDMYDGAVKWTYHTQGAIYGSPCLYNTRCCTSKSAPRRPMRKSHSLVGSAW